MEKYHIPVIVTAFVFMIAVRIQTFERFFRDGNIVFSGNDAWYHYRQVVYTVENWPQTMPFDPWTGYPIGAEVGQFGTLFDQILATIALVIGLGNPTDQTIRVVMLFAPPVIGALMLIPVYLITKRLYDRKTGVMATVFLSLIPGVFLNRSLVAVADHNIAEPLFMLASVSILLWAFDRANSNVIVGELFTDKDYPTLKDGLLPSVFAGFAISAYLLVWPPGVFFIGILAIFAVVYAIVSFTRDGTPEPVLLSIATAGLTTTVFVLASLDTMELSSTLISPVHIVFSLGVVLGSLSLAYIARVHESRENPKYMYAVNILGILGALALSLRILAPDTFMFLYDNVLRVVGFGQHANTLTIGEAQPLLSRTGFTQAVLSQYGMLFFAAVVGWVMLLIQVIRFDTAEETIINEIFLIVWSVVLTFAAFTQSRFNYYLAPVVAIIAAYAVINSLELADIPSEIPNLETYQWISLVLVIGIVLVPVLVYPFATNTVARGQAHSVGGYSDWEEPLEWMSDNTAEYESLDYYGEYQPTSNYDYGEDVYGVISWWDYGHWTTVTGERIPVANPFQQNAKTAAEYLLAQNTTEAENAVAELDGEADTRYTIVDWKMVTPTSKFGAPVVWHPDLNQSDTTSYMYENTERGIGYAFTTPEQRYYESLMVRLYHYHGSAASPGNIVVDYEERQVTNQDGEQSTIQTVPSNELGVSSTSIKRFNSTQATQQYLANDSTAYRGGIGSQPREPVDALTQHRLVKTSETSVFNKSGFVRYLQQNSQYGQLKYTDFVGNPAAVKIFERVPGATVNGTGAPANSTVVASVPMHDPTQNQTFTYRQYAETDENGNFNMTVPYSTTGYNEVTRDSGYANTSVRAEGPYQFTAYQQQISVTGTGDQTNREVRYKYWTGQTHIQESQVIGLNNSTETVTLEEQDT